MSRRFSRFAAATVVVALAAAGGCSNKGSSGGAASGTSAVGSGTKAGTPAARSTDPAAPPVVEMPKSTTTGPALIAPTPAAPAASPSSTPTPSATATAPKTSDAKPVVVPSEVKLSSTAVVSTTPSAAKPEMSKPEPVKTEPVKPEPAKPAVASPAVASPAAAKPTETKPAATQPAVAAPSVVAKPAESKPAESKPVVATNTVAKPEMTKPAETKPAVVAKPAETKPAETKPSAEKKPVAVVAMADAKTSPAVPGSVPPQAAHGGKLSVASPILGVRPGDWNQWGGSSLRNNIPEGKNIAFEWDFGSTYLDSGEFKKEEASKNVLWSAPIGSQSYGNPVIANGKVFVGTNNGHGWLKRYPSNVDLGCLIAFDEKTGKFLWQHSSEKLPTGRVHDWPLQGICCSPLVEGDKLWFVSSRGLVICLDVEGFHDGENDGIKNEPNENKDEADVLWQLDMMNELGVSQHNMCSCSVTDAGDVLFVCTSNGVDESHINLPAPKAPSFLALDKKTGKLLWKDDSPGLNILHGQWSSPAYAVIAGVPQVIFAGGDGWLYSFKGDGGKDGKAELLWKFDANPKTSKYVLGGRGTRNEIIATPVVYDDLVYLAVGQDPEHGEGIGHLWCIDPQKRGDISAELAVKREDPKTSIPHRRLQAVEEDKGEMAVPNPNSGVVWHYSEFDGNGDKKIDFEETMHRTCGTVVIKDDLLYLADFSGLFHCVNAKTGVPYWTHDLFAACWGSALIVDGKVYVGDEEGKITVFAHSNKKEVLAENQMGNSVYTTPVCVDNKLFVANKTHIFAIAPTDGAESSEK